MKKQYIQELENQINIQDAPNKAEILDRYSKRYDFGIESGLTEFEIETRLGNPKEIIEHYIENKYQYEKEESVPFSISISAVNEQIEFIESKDCDVHVQLENIKEDTYHIEQNENKLEISFKKSKFIWINRNKNGIIRIELPSYKKLDIVKLSGMTSNMNLNSFKAEEVSLSIVSGDIKFNSIDTKKFKSHQVSGNLTGDRLKGKEIQFDTVSGDVEINMLFTDALKADTINGDVILHDATIETLSSSTVSGDILINGVSKGTNVKRKIKEVFIGKE